MPDPALRVLILAGGIGSRFWPLSTPRRPKQLLPLGSDQPLITDTVRRATQIGSVDQVLVLTGPSVGRAIQGATGLPDSAFLLEPEAKGTAPVLAWAAWKAAQTDPATVLISLHADHVIDPEDAFVALLRDGARVATERDLLLTVAIPPTRPEPGYGYVALGKTLGTTGSAECIQVERFVEKPDPEVAQRYVDDGYLWNSGIFIWTASRFLEEIRTTAPLIGAALEHLEKGDVEAYFAACPDISVDDAVLARSARVATLRATFRWDDVGAWEALRRTRTSDEAGNVCVGQTHVVDSRRNVVFADEGPIVLFGVEDLVVVRTADVTMVTTRERSPALKDLLKELPQDVVNPEGS